MNKLMNSAMALALCGAIVPTSYALSDNTKTPAVTPTPASVSLQDLAAGKDYNFDLNQDGTEEKLSYTLEDNKLTVKINDEEALKLELDESYYDACLQIMDINTSEPGLDLFAYGICCSDDIGFGSLYQYKEDGLKEIWTCEYEEDIESTKAFAGGTGYVVATDGMGQFTLKMDRPIYVDCLVGNHWEAVDYKLEDGKVSLVNTDTFDIIATMGSMEDTPDNAKDVYALVPDHDLKLYKQAGKDDGFFTVPAGTSLYPKTINIAKADSEGIYVSFETDNKMSGWLCTSDYDFDNLPFGNMWFAD